MSSGVKVLDVVVVRLGLGLGEVVVVALDLMAEIAEENGNNVFLAADVGDLPAAEVSVGELEELMELSPEVLAMVVMVTVGIL